MAVRPVPVAIPDRAQVPVRAADEDVDAVAEATHAVGVVHGGMQRGPARREVAAMLALEIHGPAAPFALDHIIDVDALAHRAPPSMRAHGTRP